MTRSHASVNLQTGSVTWGTAHTGWVLSSPSYVCRLMLTPDCAVMSTRMPHRWHRFWHRFLLGWRWEKL
jgi:hypothetical protein